MACGAVLLTSILDKGRGTIGGSDDFRSRPRSISSTEYCTSVAAELLRR